MKTFLLDSFNRYKRFSEELDVKTILCNKSWLIFNDSGDKELYVFQEDGTLIASVNGNVTNATWRYIPANKSLVVSFKEQSYMLHPSFINNVIFALQQDGTERLAFMINEEQSESFHPKSLKELNDYFEGIERKRIEAEEQEKRWLIEQQRKEQQRIEEESKKQQQYRIEQERLRQEQARREEEERRIEQEKREELFKEKQILKQYKLFSFSQIIAYLTMLIITVGITIKVYNYLDNGIWVIVPPMVFCGLYFGVYRNFLLWLKEYLLNKHVQNQQSESLQKESEIKWIEKESKRLEIELNKSNEIIDSNRIILRAEELSSNHKPIFKIHNRKEFAIYWDATTMKFKDLSLLIYNGEEIRRFEGLENQGRQTVCLKKIHSPVKIMLVADWLDILIYKVTFVLKG